MESNPVQVMGKEGKNLRRPNANVWLLIIGGVIILLNVFLFTKIMQLQADNAVIAKKISLDHLSLVMSQGIVTDDLVVQKAYFTTMDNMVIDIKAQPNFADHFQGQGRFDLSDRQLKAALETLIQSVKEACANNNNISFDRLKIAITQNNYDVATFQNNNIKLKGE